MIKGKVYTQNLYTEEELLKNHVCMIPFKHMEMFKDKATLCCGTWLKKELVYPKDENGKYDYDLEDIRDTCRSVALKEMDGVIFENSIFAVNKYEGKSADELVHTEELKGKCVWLSIKRKDKGDNIKWSDKMSIMENLLGDEWLGIEIYPPAKFMVDTANQYQ